MQIIRQQNVMQRQSENYIKNELSNVAAVIQSPQILVTYYSIDPDQSPSMEGFKNQADYISEQSLARYRKIEMMPMAGIDNLVENATFDDEIGYDEDFSSTGVMFPNTVTPKPGDFFTIPGGQITALFAVTNTAPTTVRSNPFNELTFRLFSRNPETIAQLERQLCDECVTTVTAIGMDKTLIVRKQSYFEIQKHVENYLDIIDLYQSLFWDHDRSAFIFDGVYDEEHDRKVIFLDLVLWKIMFGEGIIIYDDVVTYANNNYRKSVNRIYTSCPDVYVNDHLFKQSILWRLYKRDKKHFFAEYKFPQSYMPDPRMGKFTGNCLMYFERYGKECDCNPLCLNCPVWDEEFVLRIQNNDPYPKGMGESSFCEGCNKRCFQERRANFNPSLRNAIISWYNDGKVDWDSLEIMDVKSSENYFLIPLLLGAYKQYIHDLQK